jgi:uncharacterized membrane protein YfcA
MMFAELAPEIVILLALAALLAGFIDAIAGGGGLIAMPALLLAGFAPVEALGTNKLQGLFGTGSAAITYASKGHVDLRGQLPWAMLALIGGIVGAGVATLLPGGFLRALLPVLLIAIAIYFALKPSLHDTDRASRMSPLLFGATVVPAIGFYDGIFGPGTGSFFMIAFVALAGYGVLKATAHTKLLNFASNIGGFAAFAAVGAVSWQVGLVMGVCQFVGARLGAGLAMKRGAGLIKPLLVGVCILLAVRLLVEEFDTLRALAGL